MTTNEMKNKLVQDRYRALAEFNAAVSTREKAERDIAQIDAALAVLASVEKDAARADQ